MNDVVVMNIWQFALVYLLLLIVLWVMKKCNINQSKQLVVASIRMTVQLVLAGLILTYIFKNPHPVFVIAYLAAMMFMAVYTVLSRNKGINKRFKMVVAGSMVGSGLCVTMFFILAVVGVSFFNPQYTIPIGGMIMGNTMTGVSLGLRTFNQDIKEQKLKIDTLINMGVTPKSILVPFVSKALETALVPTINSMVGMGIISLPGMMTGQMLSGTLPTTAILYQISIVIAIGAVTCFAVFSSLYFGYKTLYNEKMQMQI